MMTHEERVARLRAYLEQGRVVRRSWGGTDEQDRETACLLTALAPEVRTTQWEGSCPADVMPQWLARWTPDLADGVSATYWPDFARQYADAAGRWHVLDNAAWRRAFARVVLKALQVVRGSAPGSEGFVTPMAGIWSRISCGEEPSEDEWSMARGIGYGWLNLKGGKSEPLDWVYYVVLAAGHEDKAGSCLRRAVQAYAIAKVTAEGGSRGPNPLAERTCPAAQEAWDRLAYAMVAAINDQCNLMAEA